tara:strand:+ start:44122 stop:44721 length:600 start_codon:yes stop_codon:yes gene_type:complete
MNMLRRLINWLKTSSTAYQTVIHSQAQRALGDIRHAHHQLIAEAGRFERNFAREMQLKAALADISTRLNTLSTQMTAATEARCALRIELISSLTTRLQARQRSYERAVNLVRLQINAARHGWSKLEKEARATYAALHSKLAGARPLWAKYVCMGAEKLLHNLARERQRVAGMMTASALLYDGRNLSPAQANRPNAFTIA